MCQITKFMVSVGAVGLLMASSAFAHDRFPPAWRGQEGSTYEEWTFDCDADPTVPDVMVNPYGDAMADITVGEHGMGWRYQLPAMGEQTGYWGLGGVGGNILIDIDNRPLELEYKLVSVQVTYYLDIQQAPTVDVLGASFLGGESCVIETVETGGQWVLQQSLWEIRPNPAHEQILITSDPDWYSVIDQIVVDTICMPEPGSLLLLLVSCGLFTIRRRAM